MRRGASQIDLIYCAAGNPRFAQIALDAGFLYGVQVPDTAYFPVHFTDQDWKKPNLDRYVAGVRQHRPSVATVLDWEREEQLPEVLAWAESIAPHVETVCIIPKVFSGIESLPRAIGGKTVRLAFSIPTRYGGTSVPVWEFAGWPVHLLGGSPQRQMEYARYMDVVSTDGNMAHKLALKYGQFWAPGDARYANNRYWPKLSEAGDFTHDDMPFRAFERSCANIHLAWQRFCRENGRAA